MKKYADIDMRGNQLINAVAEKVDEAPTGTTGRFAYLTGSGRLIVYNGTDWESIVTSAQITEYQEISEKDLAEGYAGLDSNGKIVYSEIPTGNSTNLIPLIKGTVSDGQALKYSTTDGGFIGFDVTTLLVFKGTLTSAQLDAVTGQSVGWTYNLSTVRTYEGRQYNAGTNWSWEGTEWQPLAGFIDLTPYQTVANLVTAFNNPTDAQYPSAKLVKDAIDDIQGTLVYDEVPTAGSKNIVYSGGVYTSIATEITARTNADDILQGNIDTEANARSSADTTLQGNITAEADIRADADTAEANTRSAADASLQDSITAETTARTDADTTLQNNITAEETARISSDASLQRQIDSLSASSNLKDIVGTYADLQAYSTAGLVNGDLIKVLADETHNNASSYYKWILATTTWSYIGSESASYTKSETDSLITAEATTRASADTALESSKQSISGKGVANGYAGLNSSGKVPIDQIPTGVVANTVPILVASGASGQSLKLNSAGTGFEFFTPSSSSIVAFVGTITGDGSTKQFTLSHGLELVPRSVIMYEGSGKVVSTAMSISSTEVIVDFNSAPAEGAIYKVAVMG